MRYYINLFSPETAKVFKSSKRDISGFRISRKAYVENQDIGPNDKFICYVTRIQRFVGVLEVKSRYFINEKPIFTNQEDPFILRFNVEPLVWLPLIKGIPIHNDSIWSNLSFTKDLNKDSNRWTYMVFSSPKQWPREDCEFLEEVIEEQAKELIDYPFSEEDEKKLKPHRIRVSPKKEVVVSVPDDEEEKEPVTSKALVDEIRESIKVQAKLAEIGERLNFKIWIPNNDRLNVLKIWKPREDVLLDELPLVFEGTTLKTIRNIDVLWINRRAIVRAFEVEDTTSIFSGILRMADLIALQPMLDIKIHIVAPPARRDEVFKQISRPVFAVMEKGPLSELCSYIPYDSVFELAEEKRLEYMTDSIIDEYIEYPEE